MANGPVRNDFTRARQATGILLIVVAAVIVLIDAFRADFEVNPLVLVPLIVGGAAMLSVEIAGLWRGQ